MLKKNNNVYLIFIFLLTFFFLIHFFNQKLPVHDISTAYYPWAQTLKISLTEYRDIWPLWTPYGFSGTPLLMKPVLGYDSMLGLMLLIIPNTVIALKLTYVFLFLLSGITMYFLMTYFKFDKKYCFISALIYMLNGHISSKLLPWGWLTTLGGYALIPLVFLFGTKAIKEKGWIKNSIITGIIFAIMLRFGPDMKVGLWIGLIFGLYLIFNLIIKFSTKKLIKYVLVATLIILIFFGFSAQRILPIKDYTSKSARAQTLWESASSRQMKLVDVPKRLIEPGLPKIQRKGAGDHIGIIAFLLALFAIYKMRRKKIVLFFTITALLSILIANNTFGIYYFLWKYVPFFGSMRYMDRSLFIFVFSGSILAGIGTSELFKNIRGGRKKIFYIALVALILLNLWLFNYSHYTGKLEDWYNPYEVVENNHILQYISKQPGIFRIQTWETHGVDWGTDFYNVPLKLEHIYRYDTIWYPPYMNHYLSVAYRNPAKFWGILNLRYVTAMNELNVSGFKFVKKFDDCKVCFPNAEDFQKAWGPYLYENELFLPRAYIVDNSVLVVGEEESKIQTIYALMLDGGFDPKNTVIVKGEVSINNYNIEELKRYKSIILTQGSVDQNTGFILQQYVDNGGILLPNVIEGKNSISEDDIQDMWNSFSGELSQIDDENIIMHNFDKREINLGKKIKDKFLVYSEKFSVFPGWNAKADGKRVEILNADVMISAIYLDDYYNSITFKYQPRSYIVGSIITLLTLVLLIICFIYNKFNK